MEKLRVRPIISDIHSHLDSIVGRWLAVSQSINSAAMDGAPMITTCGCVDRESRRTVYSPRSHSQWRQAITRFAAQAAASAATTTVGRPIGPL